MTLEQAIKRVCQNANDPEALAIATEALRAEWKQAYIGLEPTPEHVKAWAHKAAGTIMIWRGCRDRLLGKIIGVFPTGVVRVKIERIDGTECGPLPFALMEIAHADYVDWAVSLGQCWVPGHTQEPPALGCWGVRRLPAGF